VFIAGSFPSQNFTDLEHELYCRFPIRPEVRILGAIADNGGLMATKLEKPLKREIVLNDAPYMLTISPEGLKLVPKGKRNGLELTWKGILMQATMSEAAGGGSGG
jgi:hypothetical protein